jgi:hypothetical protein
MPFDQRPPCPAPKAKLRIAARRSCRSTLPTLILRRVSSLRFSLLRLRGGSFASAMRWLRRWYRGFSQKTCGLSRIFSGESLLANFHSVLPVTLFPYCKALLVRNWKRPRRRICLPEMRLDISHIHHRFNSIQDPRPSSILPSFSLFGGSHVAGHAAPSK